MAKKQQQDSTADICKRCGVQFMTYEEKISLHRLAERSNDCLYHKECFKCTVCHRQLSLQNYFLSPNKYFYCILHCDFENGFSSSSIARQLKTFKGNSKDKSKSLLHNTSPFVSQRDAIPSKNTTDHDPQIRNKHYCFCQNNDMIRSSEGFWIECKTKECKENNYIKHRNTMIFKDFTHKISEKPFELEQYNEQIYEIAFKGMEHHNYYIVDDDINAVVLSLKQEYLNQKEYFRILVRSSSHIVEGLLPTSCICADKYNEVDVLEALRRELRLTGSFKPLVDEKYEEKLCRLDKIMHKSEFKVGLLFIKDGQETEEEFFTNSDHTPGFEEFLSFLGDKVLLKGFTGFNGGLDTSHDLTGETAIFTKWNNNEFMFHVSTLLPTDEHDDQKLQRKRHIGNDIVCIVFLSSPNAVFIPNAIKSNFLHIYIVVRPVSTNNNNNNNNNNISAKQYQVAVVSKSLVLPFGPPLQSGYFYKDDDFKNWIMTKIVNGERASYRSPKFASMQERTRKQMLSELINDQINNESLTVKTKDKNSSLQKFFSQSKQNGKSSHAGSNKKSLLFPDWMQQSFDDSEQLQKDLTSAYNGIFNHVYDVLFVVGMVHRKSLPAVKSILAARSRIFHEMFYEASESRSTKSSPSTSPGILRKQTVGKTCSSPTMSSGLKKRLSFERLKKRSHSLRKEDDLECTSAMCTVSEYLVTEFEPEEFSVLLEYLHTGMCIIHAEILPSLLSIADHYEVESLATACLESIDDTIDIYNVCPLLVLTRKFTKRSNLALELQHKILEFLENHSDEIFKAFDVASLTEDCLSIILSLNLKIQEIDKFRVVASWLERNLEHGLNDQDCLLRDSLLYNIDLKKITTDDLVQEVKGSGLFHQSQLEAELASRWEKA